MKNDLKDLLASEPYAGYAYAYPHKTSYRELTPAVRLKEAWQHESRDALFLYLHLPFCEMRCGFCNLFTTVQPKEDFVQRTLQAIQIQSTIVADEIEPEQIAQMAFGGGTPSFLTTHELNQVLKILDRDWPIQWPKVATSFEVSPATIDREKLQLLKSYHVDRISMGVQSFVAQDLKQLGRPQDPRQVDDAIEAIQTENFPVFNLDLIYGVDGQTEQAWRTTLERVIEVLPEEIYLYPLYVRELTGLQRAGRSPNEHRRELYHLACNILADAGYNQCSMRLFRRKALQQSTDYCCQDDGMIGLGPGARSYTQQLHYSTEYAVGRSEVKDIISSFNQNNSNQFAYAEYGVHLSEEEQKRRYLIKSLLRTDGVDNAAYWSRFQNSVLEDFPQLVQLAELEFADLDEKQIVLNRDGLSWSDVIGPWLYSEEVNRQMEAYELT